MHSSPLLFVTRSLIPILARPAIGPLQSGPYRICLLHVLQEHFFFPPPTKIGKEAFSRQKVVRRHHQRLLQNSFSDTCKRKLSEVEVGVVRPVIPATDYLSRCRTPKTIWNFETGKCDSLSQRPAAAERRRQPVFVYLEHFDTNSYTACGSNSGYMVNPRLPRLPLFSYFVALHKELQRLALWKFPASLRLLPGLRMS